MSNALDIHLLLEARSGMEKDAFDQKLRNFGVDLIHGGGKALSKFKDNPTVASAVLGAGMGGVYGGATADKRRGESRVRKALKGAVAGGAGGAAAGTVFSGAAKNIGRYGEGIVEHAKDLRPGGLKDVKQGGVGELLRDSVFNKDKLRGGSAIATERDAFDRARDAVRADGSDANVQKYKAAKKTLNEASGGWGGRQGAIGATGTIGAGAAIGIGAKRAHEAYQQDKTSSARLMILLEKDASFGQLIGKALGHVAEGAGKAIQVGAANPALAGAAIGATTGAIAGGEGNRLKGALGGGALGAGMGAGLAKLAPGAKTNMAAYGEGLAAKGKANVTQARDNIAALKAAKTTTTGTQVGYGAPTAVSPTKLPGYSGIASGSADGMSGGAALGTALAGTAGAGILGGAVMGSGGGKKKSQ